MKITTYRVPQLMSKMLTVICVNDRPICAVRGKKSTSDILARLDGYDTQICDGRIQKIVDEEVNRNKEHKGYEVKFNDRKIRW